MKWPIGLHQTSAMDLSPIELIAAAAAGGYDHVSLFTNNPAVPIAGEEDRFIFPKVTEASLRDVQRALDASSLHVVNAEFFLMRPDFDIAACAPGLALARALGAQHAVSHVFDPEPARAVEILGAFCDLAQSHELKVAIEFCQMTPGCKSIEQAAWFVEQVGKANLGFGICPMHLVRSGGTARKVAEHARHILFGQVNDGRGLHKADAYFEEVHDRELPGNGDFPLADILGALPSEVPIEVKIPSDSRIKAGVCAQTYVDEAFARTRPIVDFVTQAA